jgi:hypothetical protein
MAPLRSGGAKRSHAAPTSGKDESPAYAFWLHACGNLWLHLPIADASNASKDDRD